MEGIKDLDSKKPVPAQTKEKWRGDEKSHRETCPGKIDMVLLMLGGLRGIRGTGEPGLDAVFTEEGAGEREESEKEEG